MAIPQSWVIVFSSIGAFFGCICAALIYRRFVVMPDDAPLQADPIALDEARLRAADRRERRLQREMEQLSHALQERKENLSANRDNQEQLTHRIEGARTARSQGDDNALAMMAMSSVQGTSLQPAPERRGMFSHMNTPRQPASARSGAAAGNQSARQSARSHNSRHHHGAGNITDRSSVANVSSPSIVPPLNFGSINGGNGGSAAGSSGIGHGGVAHHLDNDPIGDVHFDIDKLSALAKANPAVARELALGLAMRMSEEMDQTPSNDDDDNDDDDGEQHDDDDTSPTNGEHHITIHSDGHRRRNNSGMNSAKLALEALGGVPHDFKARSTAAHTTASSGAATKHRSVGSGHYDHTSGAPKSGRSTNRSSETRAERAERRQREKKMVLSGRRHIDITSATSTAAASGTTANARASAAVPSAIASSPTIALRVHNDARHHTADDVRADGWEHASARSLPVLGHDEDGVHQIRDRITDSDSGIAVIATGLPPPKPIKRGAVPSASAVTEDDDDDDAPVSDHIRHQVNPFEANHTASSSSVIVDIPDRKRSPALPPLQSPTYGTHTAVTPMASSALSIGYPPLPPSHSNVPSASSTILSSSTTSMAAPTGAGKWVSPARTPVSPLSPPSPPFARSRTQSDAELSSSGTIMHAPHASHASHPVPPPADPPSHDDAR